MLLINNFKAACLLSLMTLFLVSCASKKDSIEAKQASLYFGAGTQSLMNYDYTEALRNLLKANELDPKNSEILNNLGMAYYFKGEKDLALKSLNESIKINKQNSDAITNLASIHFKDGNYSEAEKLYKNVLTDLTYDKQARTYFNLGMLELQVKKNKVTAENYFQKSIKEDDNYCPAYHQLGLIQYHNRQFNSALRNFKEASMGTCYEAPAPHYYQALTMIKLQKFDDARLKLNEIDTRFKKTIYASKARSKAIEIDNLKNRKSPESHASRKMFESPDF